MTEHFYSQNVEAKRNKEISLLKLLLRAYIRVVGQVHGISLPRFINNLLSLKVLCLVSH